MVDESAQQFIRVSFNTGRPMVQTVLTALMRSIQAVKEQQQDQQAAQQRGEQTPQDLNAQGREIKIMNLPQENLDALRTELNKYGVDFAVLPKGKHCEVLYKFQDVAQVEAAVQNVLKTSVADLSRNSKDAAKAAVQEATKLPLTDRLAAATKVAAERNAALPVQEKTVEKDITY